MTPEQLRALAERWRRSRPIPNLEQNTAVFMVNTVAHDMARFLDEMANDADGSWVDAVPAGSRFRLTNLPSPVQVQPGKAWAFEAGARGGVDTFKMEKVQREETP